MTNDQIWSKLTKDIWDDQKRLDHIKNNQKFEEDEQQRLNLISSLCTYPESRDESKNWV